MIRNKLASLLADRNLKISRVANDIPNLSRNTITATAQNDSIMIQIETINTLCQYLQITPNDFFEFVPFDLEFKCSFSDYKVKLPSDSSNGVDRISFNNLELDGYLMRKSNIQSEGERSKTFAFSIMQTNDDARVNFSDSSGDPFATEMPDTPLELDVMFLNDTTNKNFEESFSDFSNTWKALSSGFKADMQNNITNQLTEAVKSEIDKCLHHILNGSEADILTKLFSEKLELKSTFSFADSAKIQQGKNSIISFESDHDFPELPF